MPSKSQAGLEETAQGHLRTIGLDSAESPERTPKGTKFRWTIKRRRFCHYLIRNGGNIKQASLDAELNASEGYYLLKLKEIRDYLEWDLRNHLQAVAITSESVQSRYEDWANADIFEFFHVSGKGRGKSRRIELHLKDPNQMSRAQRRRVKKLKVTPTDHGHEVTLELVDPKGANDKLAQILGLFAPDEERKDENPDEIARKAHEALMQMEALDGYERDRPADAADAPVDPAPAA